MIGGAVALLSQGKGRCCKRTDKFLYVYILTAATAWAVKVCVEFSAMQHSAEIPDASCLIKNTSPMMLIAALALLVYFSGRSFSAGVSRYVDCLSPMAFGVYLAHTEPHIWQLLKDRFTAFSAYNPLVLVLTVVGTAFAIWAVCLAVDYLRLRMFKALRLPYVFKTVEEKIRGKLLPAQKK